MKLPIGKLDSDILQKEVIDRIKYKRDDVEVGAGIGRDCASIDFGSVDCIVSSDPITADKNDIGRLAVYVSCNDIASEGVKPLFMTMTCLLPDGTTLEDLRLIADQASEAAAKAEVQIVGGHTEITDAVTRPVISSTAFGKREKGKGMHPETIEPGDVLVLTKLAGMEGTGVIANDLELRTKAALEPSEVERAKDMLDDVSVITEGVIGGRLGVKEMHDVTEGGVLGAVWEMCSVCGLGAEINESSVPVDSVTLKLCSFFKLDYLRLVSSGCMLIAADEETAEDFIDEAGDSGIPAAVIGEFTEKSEGVKMIRKSGKVEEIDPPEADEIYKVVSGGDDN
jgi:hydrogenase expression/formation protein HypE